MEDFPISIRTWNKDDVRFITSTWLKNFKGSPSVRGMHPHQYFQHQHKVINLIFSEGRNTQALVSCNPDFNYQIYSWLVYEVLDSNQLVIHYVYTKGLYQGHGLAKQLLEMVCRFSTKSERFQPLDHSAYLFSSPFPVVYFSHKTPALYSDQKAKSLIEELNLIYNPFLTYQPILSTPTKGNNQL